MNKAKIIQTLSNLPEGYFKTAFDISIRGENEVRILMGYNAELVKKLTDGNRWRHEINGNGFMAFTRDDNFKIVMT